MKRIITGVDDIIALIIVVGCLVLICLHIDSEIKTILGTAAGYIFGKRSVAIAQKISGNKTS